MTENLQTLNPKISLGYGSIKKIEGVDNKFYKQLASWQYSSGLSNRYEAGQRADETDVLWIFHTPHFVCNILLLRLLFLHKQV